MVWFLLTSGAVWVIEHYAFAYRWKDWELARRSVEWVSVIWLGLLFAMFGVLDLRTVLGIAGAVCIGGVVKFGAVFFDTHRLREVRKVFDETIAKLGNSDAGGGGG